MSRGLTNVIVAETEISDVRGHEGFYHFRQYSANELARSRSVEDIWQLLLDGAVPTTHERELFAERIAAASGLSGRLMEALPVIAASTRDTDALAALRAVLSLEGAGAGLRPLYDLTVQERREDLTSMASKTQTIIAALHRIHAGKTPVVRRPELGYVANYLYMLQGVVPDAGIVAGLSAYIALAIDHGFNASTFTARVIASTGTDAASCIVGPLGALSGPLHGGAPSRALDTLDEIGTPENIDSCITERLAAGQRHGIRAPCLPN